MIPISLRLDGEDQQALDLLSSPKAIVARLRRRIKYSHISPETLAWRNYTSHSQVAVWWPSAEQSEQRDVRYVNGELHLQADIKPTSAMGSFRIEVCNLYPFLCSFCFEIMFIWANFFLQYSVILFPFDSPGLNLGNAVTLLEQPVDIVTAFAPGPRARMNAPPGYESEIPV